MADEQLIARCCILYAKLLVLYPKQFRESFAEGMVQTFGDLCREHANASAAKLFAFMVWTFAETSTGAIKEHFMNPLSLGGLLARPSAWLPIALSLGCLAFLLSWVAFVGVATEQQDEGPAAHIFQLTMVVQALVVAFFAVRWLPRTPGRAAIVLLIQIAAAALPVALVWMLEHQL